MEVLAELTLAGLANGMIYALIAIGFIIIYKATDVINFAQGPLLLLGAYLGYTFLSLPIPTWLGIGLALGVAALVGVAIARFALRPLIGEPVISMIMATVALSSILQALIQGIWGVRPRNFPLNVDRPVVIGVAALSLVALGWFFRKSREGLAMRAVADDQQAAMSMGVSLPRTLSIAWALASAAAALGGILLAGLVGVSQDITAIGLRVFPVVILGGLDSIVGAVIGGALIGLVEAYAGGYIGMGVQTLVPYALLLVVLMVRPYGLFGKRRMERV